jgi:cytochrome b6-f complex iron-sulfur subunit
MDRREFISMFGMGAAAAACTYCLSGCTTNSDLISAPTNVDFTVDVSTSALKTPGGYLYNGGVVVAHLLDGTYAAVSQACTHAGTTVIYDSANNRFYCPAHGSSFRTNGSVINGPAGSPLATYHTSLTGTSLRVYS